MTLKNLFRPRARGNDDRVFELTLQRENCMKRVRALRGEMQALVDQAVGADDLDQKILSLDYAARKRALAAELERFQDLSDLIGRFRSIQAVSESCRQMDFMSELGDRIDVEALQRQEDEIRIRRDMMREEAEAVDAVAAAAPARSAFEIDRDFADRVAQAAERARVSPAEPAPAELAAMPAR